MDPFYGDNGMMTTTSDSEDDENKVNDLDLENITEAEKSRIEKNLREYYRKNKLNYIPMHDPNIPSSDTTTDAKKKHKSPKKKKMKKEIIQNYTSSLYTSFPSQKKSVSKKKKKKKVEVTLPPPKKRKKKGLGGSRSGSFFSLTKILNENSQLEFAEENDYSIHSNENESQLLRTHFADRDQIKGISKEVIHKILNYNPALYFQKIEHIQKSTKKKKKKKLNVLEEQKNNKYPLRQVMENLTHLRLEKRKINYICSNILFFEKNLRSLYLDHNSVIFISTFFRAQATFKNLKYLYLDHNEIVKMENFESLEALEKLYLSHNRISKLEGLSNNVNLRELYLQYQSFQRSELEMEFSEEEPQQQREFLFDPNGLPPNLRVLDVTSCHIRSFRSLLPQQLNGGEMMMYEDEYNNNKGPVEDVELPNIFLGLVELRIGKNEISKLEFEKNFLELFVKRKRYLNSISLEENPFMQLRNCKKKKGYKWKDQLVLVAGDQLEKINGDPILANHRKFLKNRHRSKMSKKLKQSNNNGLSDVRRSSFDDDETIENQQGGRRNKSKSSNAALDGFSGVEGSRMPVRYGRKTKRNNFNY